MPKIDCTPTRNVSNKVNLDSNSSKYKITEFVKVHSTETLLDYIATNEAYYVAPVKGNQKSLEENIRDYFEDEELRKKAKKENYLKIVEKAHGTAETRECIFDYNNNYFNNSTMPIL